MVSHTTKTIHHHHQTLLKKLVYQEFENTFIKILNKLRTTNQVHYMTKGFRKAIMRRSELDYRYFKLRTNDTLKVYYKQKH